MLHVSAGSLSPEFDPDILEYTVELHIGSAALSLVPKVTKSDSIITINDAVIESGKRSDDFTMNLGDNQIQIRVTSPNGLESRTYTIIASRTITQESHIKGLDGLDYIQLGNSVAISSDTMVVGILFENNSAVGVDNYDPDSAGKAMESGAVYVFVRNGPTWSQQADLKASNPDIDDIFGYSVAISGDTTVISAAGEEEGAVYIFY